MLYTILFLNLFTSLSASSVCPMDADSVLARAAGTGNINWTDPPPNVQNIQALMSVEQFDFLFPERKEAYTYDAFLRGASKWPSFCSDADLCRNELAAVFAHITQETGGHAPGWDTPEWRQALYFDQEVGCTNTPSSTCNYIQTPGAMNEDQVDVYPPTQGKNYFGRGAKQLSWNFNYGPFSYVMTGDKQTFLDDPDMILQEEYIFAAAIWFYMTPQAPKPSMHDVITGCWQPNEADIDAGRVGDTPAKQLALSTHIINGAQECTYSSQQARWRFEYYVEYARYFDVPNAPSLDDYVDCFSIPEFDQSSSGAGIDMYFAMLTFGTCECSLVSYYTPYFRSSGALGMCEMDYCGSTQCENGASPDYDCDVSINSKNGQEDNDDGTIRCGTTWEDANAKCGMHCPQKTDGACPDGETCFADLTACTETSRCGQNEAHAEDKCGVACSSDSECPEFEFCFSSLTADSCVNSGSDVFGGTIRCGLDWDDAEGKCGTSCPDGSDTDCPTGETCFADLTFCQGNSDATLPPTPANQNTGGTMRCGTDWDEAESKCGISCPSGTDAPCPSGETCFADLTHCDGVQYPTPAPTQPEPVVTGDLIDDGAVNICYFTNWARYRSGLDNNKKDVFENGFDATLCTHINYGFGTIDPVTLAPKSHDPWADHPNGDESQDELCPGHCVLGYSGSDCAYPCNPDRLLRGFEGLTVGAKRLNPELKAILSIGGWNFNNCKCNPATSECPGQGSATCEIYSNIASSPENSRAHAKLVIEFLRKWGFDGYDIDWEYPVVAGHNKVSGEATPQDFDNYIRMLQILREEFEQEAQETGQPRLLLTAAVGVGYKTVTVAYNIAEMNNVLDLVGLMTYDMHGTWEDVTGFNAPLYATAEDEATYEHACSVEWAVDYWLEHGLDKKKLVVGFGTYGRGWKLANVNEHTALSATAGASAVGPSADSGEGFMAFHEVQYLLDTGAATEYYDEARQAPYIVTNNGEWIGYDNKRSFEAKLAFLKRKQLRGAMVWAIDLDVLNTFPLLNVIRDSLLDYNPEGPVLQAENTDDESSFTSNSGALAAVVMSSVGVLAVGGGAYYMFIAKKALESTIAGGDVEDLADLAVPKRKEAKNTAEGTDTTTLDVSAQDSLHM